MVTSLALKSMPSPRGFHTPQYKALCKLLCALRKEAGLSQRDLAKKLNMSNAIVGKMEIGDRRIDPIEFAAWCKATGVTPCKALERLGL